MSITLQFAFEIDDVGTDVTSAVLSDGTGTYGVKRDDTDAIVVAAGTAMTRVDTGTYEHEFDPPADGLTYSWSVRYVYDGDTYISDFTYADTTRVVTLTEAKEVLHIAGADHDLPIVRLIDAATRVAEIRQRRKYLTTTCIDYFDSFPAVIRPRWSPLIAVTGIEYIDTNGTLQTLSSDQYDVDADTEPGRIVLAYNCSWPDLRGDINGIVVTYTAGYGTDADDVPGEYRNAILLLVYDWFYHPDREGKLSPAATALLDPDRLLGV
jgi:uncharacterized phiE125 gp8 family phage protein